MVAPQKNTDFMALYRPFSVERGKKAILTCYLFPILSLRKRGASLAEIRAFNLQKSRGRGRLSGDNSLLTEIPFAPLPPTHLFFFFHKMKKTIFSIRGYQAGFWTSWVPHHSDTFSFPLNNKICRRVAQLCRPKAH